MTRCRLLVFCVIGTCGVCLVFFGVVELKRSNRQGFVFFGFLFVCGLRVDFLLLSLPVHEI